MPVDAGVVAFVRAALPPRPARVLEVGAGRGELAAALRDAGYDVLAIDPAGDGAARVEPVALADLEAAEGAFDAAVAVVSLHHVEPLVASCERLAELLRRGGRLVIDEFDVDRFDARAAGWQAAQRAAAGLHVHGDPADWPTDLREHLHPLGDIRAALAPAFALGEPVRGAYLYRWDLDPALRAVEERLVADGALPATGARLVGIRR
jgi:SAM-dependent methyltransferase